jgi:hypothetical protein
MGIHNPAIVIKGNQVVDDPENKSAKGEKREK